MKKLLLLISLLTFSISFSQISVSSRHIGKAKKIKEEHINRFKSSKTIFILSNIYDSSEYEKILKDTWTVTPYEIVNINDFNYNNYLTDGYSFVDMNSINTTTTKSSSISTPMNGLSPMTQVSRLFLNLDAYMLNNKKILSKLSKLKNNKEKTKKTQEIINNNKINLSRVYLHLNSDSASKILSESPEIQEIVKRKPTNYSAKEKSIFANILYSKDIFRNYKLGFLKNYFQKINNQLIKNEKYWLYGSDYTSEISELKDKTLYIPKYLDLKFNPFRGSEISEGATRIKKLFKSYKYNYKIITSDEISKKIINNEKFYYLRYVRMNTDRFIQVVNSSNGEIIYREYIHGLSFNIKSKHIKAISKAIKKASKK